LKLENRNCLPAEQVLWQAGTQTGLPNFYFPIFPKGCLRHKFQAVNGYKIIKDIPLVKSGSVYKLIERLLILTKQP